MWFIRVTTNSKVAPQGKLTVPMSAAEKRLILARIRAECLRETPPAATLQLIRQMVPENRITPGGDTASASEPSSRAPDRDRLH